MAGLTKESGMKLSLQNLSLVFVAGALGGLVNSVLVWWLGAVGFTGALGVKIAPQLTAPWLYQRLVWGGIWGCLFLVPLGSRSFPARGLWYSLGPTLATYFLVFPLQAHKGVLGLQLGSLTPAVVLFYNAVWGVVAGWWLSATFHKSANVFLIEEEID
jgi:hypothetical protein